MSDDAQAPEGAAANPWAPPTPAEDAVPEVSAGPVDAAPATFHASHPSSPGQGPTVTPKVPLDKEVDVPRAEPNPWAPPVDTPRPPRHTAPAFPSVASPHSPSAPYFSSAPSAPGEPVPPPPVGPEGPGRPPYGYDYGYGYPAYGPQQVPHHHHGGPGYGWPVMPLAPSNGMGTAGLVLGILSALVFCLWPLAIVLGVLGVVFGALGRRKARRGEATNAGQALAGIICGAVGIALGIAVVVIVLVVPDDGGDGDSDDGGDGFSTSLSLSRPPAAEHVRQDL